MDSWKESLKEYLPTVEEFLTSLLLEETYIEVASFERVESESVLKDVNSTDIFLYAREHVHSADVILVLDQEWFGLLSSIMLGIEEKEKNETTIELLEEFSGDLSKVIVQAAGENDLDIDLNNVQVLSKSEVQEKLAHREYLWSQMDIGGIADDEVRAELLLGDPAMEIQPEEAEEDQEEIDNTAEDDSKETENSAQTSAINEIQDEPERSTVDSNKEHKNGKKEEVISARHIEFAEFEEEGERFTEEIHNMDLLKDVELDVSVELGRIELPLGKVLQLAKGSVVELEKLAGEPVDILVNGNRIALGEVVVIDEHFGVRISSLVTTKKRLAKINNGS